MLPIAGPAREGNMKEGLPSRKTTVSPLERPLEFPSPLAGEG